MKKQIYIVELYEHHEVVRVLAKLFVGAGYDVTIFAEEKVLTQLGKLSTQSITKKTTETEKAFLRKQLPTLNQADIVLFTTLVKYPKFYANLKFKTPTIILVHDGNYFLRPNQNISIQNSKDVLRWLKFKLLREARYRKLLLQNFSYVSFADDFIAQSFKKEIKELSINVLPALPLTYYEGTFPQSQSKTTIIIPGSVSPTRNYQVIFDAFRKIEFDISKTIELVLLGSAKTSFAKKVVKLLGTLDQKKIKVISFYSAIPQAEYDAYLQKSNFAILPINQQFVGGIFKEKFGKTKITGSANDVVRFGTPTLISKNYPTKKELGDIWQSFENVEKLASLITKWLDSSYLLELRQKEEASLNEYSFDKLVKQVDYFLQK